MMDFGGLDVGINCKYTPLFDDSDEPLFTLIDQGVVHGGQATRNNLVENVFSDSFDDDAFAMPLYERKLLMTMQMASSASSLGLEQPGRAGSLMSFDPLSSRNFIDDTYDLVVRERNPSTSSFAGLCIHPDLMMNTSLNSSTDEFLADSLPVIEDLQDQMFLEDGHQNLQPDDLLIPLDEAIDGKALQEQLINQITGNNQSLLAVNTCEGNTPPNLGDPSPSKSEVSVSSSHTSLVICTRDSAAEEGACTGCAIFSDMGKNDKVRFRLGNATLSSKNAKGVGNVPYPSQVLEMTEILSEKNCNGTNGVLCHLNRFLQTLASFGIGKKVVIRRCRGFSTNGCKSLILTRLHLPSKVKKVETTPGSQNVCIDGTNVELPAGSVVLAVMNENGALVTLPTTANPCGDDVTKLSSSPELEPSSDTHFACSNLPSISSMDKTPTPLELHPVSENENVGNLCLSVNKDITNGHSKDLNLQFINGCGDAYPNIGTIVSQNERPFSVKKEVLHLSPDQSDTEDVFVDVETVSETTPVIEAVDLDTLLAEFEATETANIQVEKKPRPMLDLDEGDFLGFETPHPNEPSPSLKARSLLIKKEVQECEESEQRASVESLRSSLNSVMEEQPVKQLKKVELESKPKLYKRMTHQKIKDSLPVEIIEKIKASSKRSKTKILPEPLVPVPKAKKLHSKSKLPKKKCSDLRREQKHVGCAQKDTRESAIPAPIDHTYCCTPEKKSQEKDSGNSSPKIFNKLPDYVQDSPPEVKVEKSIKSDVGCKKDNEIESNTSGSSLEIEPKQIKKENETLKSEETIPLLIDKMVKEEIDNEVPLYSRLPDYVTDIGNLKPKIEVVEEEINCETETFTQNMPESSLGNTQEVPQVMVKEEQPKKKKKLKLDEYRMRMISSANNSRSNSPLVGEDPLVKKGCKNQGVDESIQIKVESPATANLTSIQPLTNPIVEEREEGEIKEDPDDVSASTIPQDVIEPPVKTTPMMKKHSHRETKISAHHNWEAKTSANRESKMATVAEKAEKKEQDSRSAQSKPSKTTRKQPTVIEIDLVEEEEKEKERQQKGQTKLGLIDSLPLSKMPTTSLGHSLLYSRKNGDNPDKKIPKYDYSKVSNHHRFSSSRSRSPSWSSKRSSRSYKSKESSRYTSHRKSRRRWSRSRSRGRSRSRSYSASSTSSFISLSSRSRSRSRSTSYSKSYNSRSRSRSRSNRRWDRSRSRRSKRYSRSKESSRDRSRRRSWSKSPQEWGHSWKRGRSPNWGYHSRSTYTYGSRYPPAPPSSRYASRYRNSEHVDNDGDERRIIYVGSIDEGTTRADLRRKFDKFGPIVDINIHFRENGDNYGFVTFRYQQHAYDAMEHGNDDPSLSEYSLCFGARRTFCKVEYSDLDAQNEDYDYHVTPATMDYDTLLKSTLHMRR